MPKEKSESYKVIDFPIETEPRIKDNETGETYNLMESLNLILNEIKEIKKEVV